MIHIAAFLCGMIAFGVATALLFFGRHALGESTALLLSIVGGYLLALGTWFPARMDLARAQLVAWYMAWKAK